MCLMSRVFISAGTGAAVYVFANDHCPPHVHAKHRGENTTMTQHPINDAGYARALAGMYPSVTRLRSSSKEKPAF
jgi:hypothetical protein